MAALRTIQNTPEDQSLKAACKALVRAVGGVEAAESYCRVGKTLLSDYGNPHTDTFMPVDVAKDLERDAHGTAGFPQVTRFLARQAGFSLVALPEVGTLTPANLLRALSEASRDHANVAAGLLDALADHQVTEEEADRLAPIALQSAEAAMRLHALLKQLAGKG